MWVALSNEDIKRSTQEMMSASIDRVRPRWCGCHTLDGCLCMLGRSEEVSLRRDAICFRKASMRRVERIKLQRARQNRLGSREEHCWSSRIGDIVSRRNPEVHDAQVGKRAVEVVGLGQDVCG